MRALNGTVQITEPLSNQNFDMNSYRQNNYANNPQVNVTLCGWVRVAEISLPILSQQATHIVSLDMAKDFGHDPGGSDG